MNFIANIIEFKEPERYHKAKEKKEWVKEMEEEIRALEANETWEITSLPPGRKPIGCRWVYKVKLKHDGSVERHKSRLVAKGYSQKEGVDFVDSFSPVAKVVIVRIILALAAANGWGLHQLDVNNAFLHGFLEEELYMEPPEGYGRIKPRQVCKFKKSLYGSKQASRQWNVELTRQLHAYGFKQSSYDHCLFVLKTTEYRIILLVYVDDILLTRTSEEEIEKMKRFLDAKFTVKDLKTAKYFLGLELTRSNEGLFVNQRKYVLDLLEDVNLIDGKGTNVLFQRGTGLCDRRERF